MLTGCVTDTWWLGGGGGGGAGFIEGTPVRTVGGACACGTLGAVFNAGALTGLEAGGGGADCPNGLGTALYL